MASYLSNGTDIIHCRLLACLACVDVHLSRQVTDSYLIYICLGASPEGLPNSDWQSKELNARITSTQWGYNAIKRRRYNSISSNQNQRQHLLRIAVFAPFVLCFYMVAALRDSCKLLTLANDQELHQECSPQLSVCRMKVPSI